MSRSSFFRSVSLFACLVAFALVFPAYSAPVGKHPVVDPHHVNAASLGGPIDLSSTWLMQQGDDPRWADPNFDDSKWTVFHAGKNAASYGFRNVDGIWYRTHVQIPPNQQDLSLLIRAFGGSFQIFVNGVEVGSSGPHPQGGSFQDNFDQRFSVPDALIRSGDVTIAIRANIGRQSEGGIRDAGFTAATTLLFGATRVLSDSTLLFLLRNYASSAANISMELLVPLLALALALTLPREREYLALFISGSALVCFDLLSTWQGITHHKVGDVWYFLRTGLQVVEAIGLLEFVRLVLGLRRSRWWAGYEWLIGIVVMTAFPWIDHALDLGTGGASGSFVVTVQTIAHIVSLPLAFGLPLLALWVWWKRQYLDALLLFVPLFLQAAIGYADFAIFILNRLHVIDLSSLPPVPIRTFFLQWGEVASFLFSVALMLFLVLRTVRIARSRAAMSSDLHAVQSVQEILLARASNHTPGFRVEHVYLPAAEVGGDFFLVSPGPNNSLTAIVGDVSGKGLVAAMRVSMILGVLRREEQREPETILRNLNDALLLQEEMGFTTACCVRLERDGRYTIANAGHIPPYIGGKEIPTPDSLPLGIVANQEYEQVTGVLPHGKTMVLMSDGVVEARSAKGELYGFHRLPNLTLMSAQDIADVAQRFGQADDITVVTVSRGA